MSSLILPSRRIVQPAGPVDIDWSNPLARGLVFAVEGDSPTNYARKTMRGALGSGVSSGVGAYGRQLNFNGSVADFACNWASTDLYGATESTIELMFYYTNTTSSHAFSQWSSESNHWLLQVNGSTGVVWVPAEDNSGNRRRWDGAAFIPNAWQHLIASWRGGSSYSFVVNGVSKTLSAVNTAATSICSSGTSPIQIGTCKYGNDMTGSVAFARAWNRGLSDREIERLFANAKEIFKPVTRRIYFDVGAGGPATYSDSFTESLTAAYSTVDSAIYNSAIASGVTASDGDAGTLTLAESIAAGVTAADAVLSSTTFADAHSAGVTASTALVSIQIVLETLASSVTAGYTQSDSLVGVSGTTYNETHSAGITASFSVVSVQTFVAALSEALTAAESLTSNADYQIALSEALTALDSYTVSDGTTTLTAADLAAIAALIDARIADIAAATLAAAQVTPIQAITQDNVIEGTLTEAEAQRIMLAALAGRVTKSGTNIKFKSVDGLTDRIDGTVDTEGNRTAVTLDGSA